LVKPLVIVQRIDTIWTSGERDAQARELRARLPRAYALPDSLVRSDRLCARHFVKRSAPSYSLQHESRETDDDVVSGHGAAARTTASVRLALVRDDLEVTFLPTDAGEPRRGRRVVRLRAATWMRVQYNGRFRDWERGARTWYEEKIMNIAFRTPPRSSLFKGQPMVELDLCADLW
jgi:hypothetical protein